MTIRLNPLGAANARALIAAGKVDKASSWKHSGHEGPEWYLGTNSDQPPAASSHYAYLIGRAEKAYRSAIVSAKDRALRNGDTAIADEASALLALIDKPVPDPAIAARVAAATVTKPVAASPAAVATSAPKPAAATTPAVSGGFAPTVKIEPFVPKEKP